MGWTDRSKSQYKAIEGRHISGLLRHIEDYELVKQKRHEVFEKAQDFYDAKGICKQNFLKYYRRYLLANRDISSLVPHKSGRKFKDAIQYEPEIITKIQEIRKKGYNRFDISRLMGKLDNIEISPTAVYRLMKKLGINRLNPAIKEEKRRIIKMSVGEMGHIDIHYVSKGTVKETGNKKLYILGIIDDYSRVCWLEVIDSIKSLNVMFASLDVLMILKDRYNIQFSEMMSDNGSEFSSRNNPEHPFEKMLSFYDVKHRYTKPCSPQTNGKIERFWKTLEDELLSGETFETLEEFQHYIRGYCVYYNEHRIHQGINNKMPVEMVA